LKFYLSLKYPERTDLRSRARYADSLVAYPGNRVSNSPPIATSRQRAPLAPGFLSNFKAAHRTTQLYKIKSLYRG